MNGTAYYEVFRALGAELVLAVLALLVLSLDILSFRNLELRVRTRRLGTIVGLGLLAALLPLCQLAVGEDARLLGDTLVVNDLTILFKLLIVALTVLTAFISAEGDVGTHVGEYYATLLFAAIGMLLLVSAEELLTVFVALELTSIGLYILTAFAKERVASQEAALKYFLFGAISSAFLLFGISYLIGATGATTFTALRARTEILTPLLSVGLLFVLVGLGFKVAVVPLHLWAPDTYEGAPTPVTAFIATASKVASFLVLTKLLFIGFGEAPGQAFWGRFAPGWTMVVALVGTASMVWGNVAAIVQRNIKRLLAYSSIAHAGYIFIGLVAATTMGASAVLFYVIVYALTNLGAFGVVVALSREAGGDDLDHFNGMARRAPFLSLLMLVFVLSLAGVPPLGGFFGKFYLFAAAVGRDAQEFGLLWLVVVGILMSAVSLYYYLVLLKHMYVVAPATDTRIRTPGSLTAVLALLAAGVLGIGLFPQPILELLNNLVARL